MSRYPDSHFKVLDADIVAAISGGTSSYSTLCQRFGPEARALCPDKDASRVIDRRLQTLRRAGHIVYAGSSGWKAAASPPKVSVSLAEAQLYAVENLRELAAELIVLWDTAKRPAGGRLDALISLCQAKVGAPNAAKVAEHMICDACVRKSAQ